MLAVFHQNDDIKRDNIGAFAVLTQIGLLRSTGKTNSIDFIRGNKRTGKSCAYAGAITVQLITCKQDEVLYLTRNNFLAFIRVGYREKIAVTGDY